MALTAPPELLQDAVAVSIAQAVVVANRRAIEAGVDIGQSIITIRQIVADEEVWRVNYGTRARNQRGGDFIVDVDARDATIKRVLLGQ